MVIASIIGIGAAIFSVWVFLLRYFGEVFENKLISFFAAIPLAAAAYAALASLFLLVAGTVFASIAAFLILIFMGAVSFRRGIFSGVFSRLSRESIFLVILGGILSLVISVLVIKTLDVQSDDMIGIAAGGATADTPYHLAQIVRISETPSWDFDEPNFAGEFIRYPYFLNLVSGILVTFGMPLEVGMHLPAILLSISGVALILYLFRWLGLNPYFSAIAALAVFFGGGLGYIAYLQGGDVLELLVRGRSVYPAQNIGFPGLVPGLLIHQRPFLLGLPLFLVGLIALLRGIRNDRMGDFTVSGIALGLLPFSHMHSFLALASISGAALLYAIVRRDPIGFDIVRGVGFISLLLAIPQLSALLLLPEFSAGNFVTFRLGWMTLTPGTTGGILWGQDGSSFYALLRYWITNFSGLLLLFPLSLLGFRRFREDSVYGTLVTAAFFLWLIPNVMKFQVWDFDTNKLFVYAILVSIAALGIFVMRLEGARRYFFGAVFLLIAAVSLPSSLIAAWHGVTAEKPGVIILNEEERAMADWIRVHTPDDAVLISSLSVTYRSKLSQDPVVAWSGRRMSSGNVVFMYTHGIDFAERLYYIEEFLKNPAAPMAEFAKVPADYILIDDIMREKYPRLEAALQDLRYPALYESGSYKLISLKRGG